MIVKHKTCKIHYMFLTMLVMILLQGCGQEKYVKEQAEAIVGKGRPILEEYINSLPEETNITDISMIGGGNQGDPSFNASLPSYIVQAAFTAGDEHYTALVNLEDGKVYSNYEYIDPNELIQRQLMFYLDEYGFDGTYDVTGAFYSYAFVSHGVEVKKGKLKDVYVYIDNMPTLTPVENADEFMNASISGFDIEYESENNDVFEPEILYNYLTETGNYRRENIRGDIREYHIKGGRGLKDQVNGEPSYYEVDIICEGNPDTMTCDVLRWDYKEEDGLCYYYVGGTKNGNINNIDEKEYVEHNCPFEFIDNILTYGKDENSPYEGYLFIKNPQWDEIVMTRYNYINKSSEEKTNDSIDRWELEPIAQDELEIVKSDLADLFEFQIKGTNNICEFTDDKVVLSFK